METPKNASQVRPSRNPTPRLSERKKNLFAIGFSKSNSKIDEDVLDGITPLGQDGQEFLPSYLTPQSKSCLRSKQKPHSTTRRSLRLDDKNITLVGNSDKENKYKHTTAEEQLPMLFTASMRLGAHLSPVTPKKNTIIEKTLHDEFSGEFEMQNTTAHKRAHEDSSSLGSPQRKVARVETSLENVFISTKSFYSSSTINFNNNVKANQSTELSARKTSPRRIKERNAKSSINKGVRHKIRRTNHPGGHVRRTTSVEIDAILNKLRNEKLRNLITAERKEKAQIEKVHSIFRKCANPITMARPLSVICNQNDVLNNNNNNNNKGNISISSEADFSDIENSDDSDSGFNKCTSNSPVTCMNEQTEELSSTYSSKRKFFKSGRAGHTQMVVKITGNIRAKVCNGKISLVQKAKKKMKTRNTEFSEEQAAVEAILNDLDNTSTHIAEEALSVNKSINTSQNIVHSAPSTQASEIPSIDMQTELFHVDMGDNDYAVYRKRLPYNTTDQTIVEQQHVLLDFLIANNICTEKNFAIFITDPENQTEEPKTAVEKYTVLNSQEELDFRNRIPFNTNDPEVITQQRGFMDFIIEHNICSEENFDIFIANFEQRSNEAASIIRSLQKMQNSDTELMAESVTMNEQQHVTSSDDMSMERKYDSAEKQNDNPSTFILPKSNNNSITTPGKLFPIFNTGLVQPLIAPSMRLPQRVWTGGKGDGQYQIDAGQKHFGAKQCTECGLVYTVHEPEEEKIHRDYHASLHVLRFKGWIDEDIVASVTEWSPDGRIIRVCNNSNVKRRERIDDILKVVDNEIGFSSYIIPSIFVAYIAVIKAQIVGLCLVQPLQKANKFVCINGADCCTEDEFEAKCGISRIWVSPLHRRRSIATKLIRTVMLNTIDGEEIPIDKIAFSAPTDNGKIFAQKITGTDNFLVYQ